MYGPGLAIGDLNLGILYMLAVSSLATYGILLAGFSFPANIWQTKIIQYYLSNMSHPILALTKRPVSYHQHTSEYLHISRCFIHTWKNKSDSLSSAGQKRFLGGPTQSEGPFILLKKNSTSSNNNEYIKDLFKDRIAPVIPFDRELIKGSCLDYTDKILKAKFLKEWGAKAGIYLIEYKYYPDIYYIGRTNLFKKRFF